MEPEVKKEEAPAEQPHLIHTYQDDLARAMNATEAPVVQELLADARGREKLAAEEIVEHREEKWYGTTAFIFIILTIAVIAFGAYYYTHLTVPVRPATSIGVFQSTDNIVASSTTIDAVIAGLTTGPSALPQDTPVLINLVTDAKTDALLSDTALFSFMQAAAPEPLQSVMSSVRLGAVNLGNGVVPFIIASVPNPQKASQEFLNEEPTLLQLFAKPLNINTAAQTPVPPFQSQYFFNLPVRVLFNASTANSQQNIAVLYGYANSNIIVITTQPQVLKDVYDSLVKQMGNS